MKFLDPTQSVFLLQPNSSTTTNIDRSRPVTESMVRAAFVAIQAKRDPAKLADQTWMHDMASTTSIDDVTRAVAKALDDAAGEFNRPESISFNGFFHDLKSIYLTINQRQSVSQLTNLECIFDDNGDCLISLLRYERRPRSILDKIHQRHKKKFEDDLKSDALINFYSSASKLALSDKTAGTLAQRFVAPGNLSKAVHHAVVPRHGSIHNHRANAVCGWSGSGKTTFVTTPTNANSTLYCLLIAADDIFVRASDTSSSNALHGKLRYEGDFERAHGLDRDRLAAAALVVAIFRALGATMREAHCKIVRECFFGEQEKKDESGKTIINNMEDGEAKPVLVPAQKVSLAMETLFSETFGVISPPVQFADAELRISLDEVGGYPLFVRALCSCWSSTIRPFLETLFKLKKPENSPSPPFKNFFLFIAGTGTEDIVGSDACGSYPDDYSVSVVQPRALFAKMLDGLVEARISPDKKEFYRFVYSALYDKDSVGEVRPRPQIDEFFVFGRLVHDNARCAALAIRKLQELADSFGEKRLSQRRANFELFYVAELLRTWSGLIAHEFIQLNGLNNSERPIDDIADALRIVVSRAATITPEDREKLIVKYGILVDNAKDAAEASNWEKPSCRFSIAQSFVAIYLLSQKMGRYRFGIAASDVFEQLVAEHHALCLALRPTIGDRTPTLVRLFAELNKTNTILNQDAALPSSSSPTSSSPSNSSIAVTSATSSSGAAKRPKNDVYLFNLKHQLTDHRLDELQKKLDAAATSEQDKQRIVAEPSEYFKNHFSVQNQPGFLDNSQIPTWKQILSDGGSVVLVNAPQAPFADVITLVGGDEPTLILTQCKHLQPGTRLSTDRRQEEFDKMLTDTHNINTRQLLMNCCRPVGDATKRVKVVALIIACHEESFSGFSANPVSEKINNVFENFEVQKYLIAAFGKEGSQGASIEDSGAYDTRSALYPLLHSALVESHLKSPVAALTAPNIIKG